MTTIPLLFNLLSYRPEVTGLTRYVQRLLAAWPEPAPPLQLRITAHGHAELSSSEAMPSQQQSAWIRQLQAQALVQHAVPARRLLRDHWPELIYSPFTDWLWALSDIPQVITCHDLTPLYYPNSFRSSWRSRVWLPQHLKRARLVVAISRSVADQLVKTGLPASRIAIVPNGVEPVSNPVFEPASRDCVVLARHARNKNLALALNGFAALLARQPHWPGQLVVVGRADRCTPALRRQQHDLGLVGKVRWVDQLAQTELDALLRKAFCLISTSLMEGFDYPLLEAQALGLPTLASRIPVHEELHSDASLLFDLQDHGTTMGAQLLRLDREPALWRQLSQAGLRNAGAHTSQRQARELHQLLNSPLP